MIDIKFIDLKEKVRAQVERAVKKGTLKPNKVCENCNVNKKLDAHHDDYHKALSVRWFCRSCHGKHHRNIMNEQRTVKISARITPTLYKKVLKKVKNLKWSVSDLVEEALTRIITDKVS